MPFAVQFNAATVAPAQIPEPVPTAVYSATLVGSEEKLVKDGEGQAYYEMISQIIEGEYKGRKITDRLNYKNKSPQAVDIAFATLSAICHVTGVMQLTNSQELHGKPYKISVAKVARRDDATRYTNEIRQYLFFDGSEPGKAQSIAAAAPANPAFSTQAAVPVQAVPPAPGAVAAYVPPAPVVAAAPPPPPPPTFPPAGWAPHPSAPGYFYMGQEVLSEADLRARMAIPPNAAALPTAYQPQSQVAAGAPAATPSWAS